MDLGIDCQYVAEGKSEEEVMEMAKEHAMRAHPEEMKEKMDQYTEEELDDTMKEKIKEEEA